jgi:8-oxo-dGTP pyrophosphatase MutT (NUDIX family)
MLNEVKNPWKILDSSEIYNNPWIKLTEHKVLNPSNNPGIYSVVHFKHLAIGVIPLDENLNTWIVGQYRFPLNKYSWEIPEGGGKHNADPLESAKRELSEEVGLAANKWTLIQEFNTSNSVTDEHSLIYLAQELSFHESHPEDDEELIVKKIPFSELYDMVLNGEIMDSLTIVAVYKTKALLDQKLI